MFHRAESDGAGIQNAILQYFVLWACSLQLIVFPQNLVLRSAAVTPAAHAAQLVLVVCVHAASSSSPLPHTPQVAQVDALVPRCAHDMELFGRCWPARSAFWLLWP